jgi:hypothetical protein
MMSKRKDDPAMAAADSRADQAYAEIRDAARDDIAGWAEFGRKLNDAVSTRLTFAQTTWTNEERYRMARLAHLAHMTVTGRLLGRDV